VKLNTLGEKELISFIRKKFSVSKPNLIIGIGDDAAVIKAGRASFILTKDLLIENFHFSCDICSPYLLGRKSLSVNLSDIASVGGKPEYALLGLGLPSHLEVNWVEEFFSGMNSVLKEQRMYLIGGDISQAEKITISITVVGRGKNIIKRGGAKPGHILCVSGTIGDAAQGLVLLKKKVKMGESKRMDPLLRAFLDPFPQITLGRKLSSLNAASAMIDISDGLSIDLAHICQESRCGAEIYIQKIPISSELSYFQKNPYEMALHGGEDYQLLFSIPPENIGLISGFKKKYRITQIGRMIQRKSIYMINEQGRRKKLEPKGYQHFS